MRLLISISRRVVWPTLLAAVSGCATTSPSIHSLESSHEFSYSGGRGVQDFAAHPNAVVPAVFASLTDLQMSEVQPTRDGVVTRIEARTRDGRAVSVTVRPRDGAAQVGARIGWFGDEALSKALLERVGVRAGTRDPEAIPDEPPSTPSGNPYFSRSAIPDEVMLRDLADAPYHDRVIP